MTDDYEHAEDALKRLADVQQLGQALFQREAGRRAREYGVTDERTQRMIRTAGGARAMLDALHIARDSAPQDVTAATDETAVYGRAATDDLKGVAGLRIDIEDTNGRVMRAAGSATTDPSGRFAIRIPPGVASRLADKDYIVTARNTKGEVVYRAPSTVRLELSKAIHVDVELGTRTPIGRPAPTVPPRPTQPETPAPSPSEPQRRTAVFRLRGVVLGANGKPASSVLVRVYDKDVRYDDLLGAALTSRKGEFTVQFRLQDFAENETTPDLYFIVANASDEVLLETVADVSFDEEGQGQVQLTIREG
jgi:hypothetical protein